MALVTELGRRAWLGSSEVCLHNQTPQRAPVLRVGLGVAVTSCGDTEQCHGLSSAFLILCKFQ